MTTAYWKVVALMLITLLADSMVSEYGLKKAAVFGAVTLMFIHLFAYWVDKELF